jgi:hypothetical protein
MFRSLRTIAALLLILIPSVTRAVAQETSSPTAAPLPVLVTSAGQALDGFTTKTLLTRANVPNDYKPLAEPGDLGDVKTLIIVMGASVKGFGQAGITAESEMTRTKALLAAAKEKKIHLIGVHIGGADRREGMSKQFVELVAPAVDHLVVWQDGNADGYFSKIADEKKIPLTLLQQPIQAGKILAPAFGK